MDLTTGKFTFATYANSSKNIINAIWLDEGTKEYSEVAVVTDLKDKIYQKLLEKFTPDEISTMTDQKHKEEASQFEYIVKDIAKKYNLIYDPTTANPEDKLNLDHIFNPTNDDVGTDLLFNLKIKIFDLPEIQKSENSELKKKLREAKTPLESLYIAGKFLYE
jgi:hypothetical protein